MKLIIREYLSGLRERGELDAIIPDLLSELGFNVLSLPSIGTRQHGVDVAAVGKDEDGEKKLFLFSIKSGNLTRQDWDGSAVQSLRPSLNEIQDVYLKTKVPERYKELNVVICLCFGGYVEENIQDAVRLYQDENRTDRVSFDEWNGDKLAQLILDGLLQERVFQDRKLRSSFQKAVAMVDQPEIAYWHFSEMADRLVADRPEKPSQVVSMIRELYVCTWILFVWARDAENLESAFKCCELATLKAWHVAGQLISKKTKAARDSQLVINQLVSLYWQIWSELFDDKILPHADKLHSLSNEVRSQSPVDINLKMFDLLGRMALRGLWLDWTVESLEQSDSQVLLQAEDKANALCRDVVALVRNNPSLLAPICDEQSIEITLALMFLTNHPDWHVSVKSWVNTIAQNWIFCIRSENRYPTIRSGYRELLVHPKKDNEEYFKEVTAGSTLLPILACWAEALNDEDTFKVLIDLSENYLEHCNSQLWLPNIDTEEKLYDGDTHNGAALSDIVIGPKIEDTRQYIEKECTTDEHFEQLSAVQMGHEPIIAMACRHYRLPIPPQLWLARLAVVREQHDLQ